VSQRLAVARRFVGPGLFLLLAVAVTWPFAIHPGSTTSAFIGGDVTISITKFRLLADEGLGPFSSGVLHTVGWPGGVRVTPTVDTVSWINTAYLYLGTLVMGSIATHGLMALLGMFLTATITMAFVTEITGSRLAGFVAGTAYGFFAHMIVIAWAASTYTWMFLLLLPMWAMYRLAREPSLRRAILAGLAYLPALYGTPYFGVHAGVVAGTSLLVFVLVRAAEDAPLRRRLTLAAVVVTPWVAGLAIYLAIGVANDFTGVPTPPEKDHYEQAAHPLMYVVPATDATLYGDAANEWLARRVPRAAGVQLYLGISVVLLALVGFVTALAPWVRSRARVAPPAALAALMAGAVALATFGCSMPPRVWNHRLPTPSALIFAIEPGLRAGQRFVMPLMGAMAVLAGLGAWALLRRFAARPAVAVGLTAVLAAVVFMDTHMAPPDNWVRTPPKSAALAKLAAEPPGPTLHWHYSGFLPVPAPRACFLQPQHHKVLVNDCALRLDRNPPLVKWDQIPACEAIADARRTGVRYVIVDIARQDVVKCFDREPSRIVGRDADMTVFAFTRPA
jgi:hypothetical protein